SSVSCWMSHPRLSAVAIIRRAKFEQITQPYIDLGGRLLNKRLYQHGMRIHIQLHNLQRPRQHFTPAHLGIAKDRIVSFGLKERYRSRITTRDVSETGAVIYRLDELLNHDFATNRAVSLWQMKVVENCG